MEEGNANTVRQVEIRSNSKGTFLTSVLRTTRWIFVGLTQTLVSFLDARRNIQKWDLS
jgi:hypothetical protein